MEWKSGWSDGEREGPRTSGARLLSSLRGLTPDTPTGLVRFDLEANVLFVSDGLARLLGRPRHELVGRPLEELFSGVRLPWTGQCEVHLPGDDGAGQRLSCVSTPVFGGDGRIRGALAVCFEAGSPPLDEAGRSGALPVAVQEKVQRVAREWQLTFDAVSSAILILDEDDRVMRLNRTAMELTGRSYTDSLGRQLAGLGPTEPWPTAAKVVEQARATGDDANRQVRDPATAASWDVTANMVRQGGDSHGQVIVIAREITEMVELQESLRRSEVMSVMGSLVAGVAHEVRNPLFGISATLDALEVALEEHHDLGSYLQVLRGEVVRMQRLMQDLLEYGRPTATELEPGSLEAVVRAAVAACRRQAREEGVELEVRTRGELPPVAMDRTALEQVFQNLLSNAVHFSPQGSEVVVDLSLCPRSGRVCCVLEDRGPGFEEADLDRLFEPFYSRRRGGTGLGLAIVQRLVEHHGGEVTAENREGGGARMTVDLPAMEAPAMDGSVAGGGEGETGREDEAAGDGGDGGGGDVAKREEGRDEGR